MKFNLSQTKIIFIFFLLLLISTVFLSLLTKEHYFFSDDFFYIIGPKLYTLITGEGLKFTDVLFNLGPQDHYAPLYYYYLQFMPSTAIKYHFVTILFHSLGSILVFFISIELIKDRKIALLASMFYFYNMSMHAWPIVWNAFNAHIINSVTGFFALYLSIKFLKLRKSEFEFLFLFVISVFSAITIFIYESGFLYILLIIFFMIFSFENLKKRIKVLISVSIPVIIYFGFVFHLSGNLHPVLSRANNSSVTNFYEKSNVDAKSLYAARSNYAERNLKNYSFRVADNILNTFNLGILEQIIKERLYHYDKVDSFKLFIKNNKVFLINVIILMSLLGFYLFIKIIINNYKDKTFLKLLILYLFILFVCSIIYFRKDLNMSLAFCGSLLIAYTLSLFKKNKKIIKNSIKACYFIISIIFISSGMKFVHVDYQRDLIKKKFENLHKSTINFDKSKLNSETKFYYYYKNYSVYKNQLTEFTNKNSYDFHSFANNFVNFKPKNN